MGKRDGEVHRTYLDDYEHFDSWVIYGHVSDGDARAMVRSYEGDNGLPLGAVTRSYERAIPAGGDDGGPYVTACSGPARGASAVTHVYPAIDGYRTCHPTTDALCAPDGAVPATADELRELATALGVARG